MGVIKAQELLTKAVTAQKDEAVSKLASRMKRNSARDALIMDGDKFIGIFSQSHFLGARENIRHHKAGHFLKNVAHVDAEDSLLEVVKEMLDSDSFLLPVYKEKKYIGAIGIFDVFNRISEEKIFSQDKNMTGKELKRYTETIYEDETINAALTLMYKRKIRDLLVLDRYSRVVGIVEDSTLLIKYYLFHLKTDWGQRPNTKTRGFTANPARMPHLPVKNIISRAEPVYVKEDETLAEIVKKMTQHKVLSVVVKGSTESISAKEILRKVQELQPEEKRLLQFVGLQKLKTGGRDDPVEKRLHAAAERYVQKISRHKKGTFNTVVHIKEHQKQGKRRRYEVHTRINFPTAPFTAKVEDWNLVTAVRRSFEEVLERIEKKNRGKISVKKR